VPASAIGTGSAADQINALVMQLRGIADLAELEYRWPRIVRTLESLVHCLSLAKVRGGSSPAVAGPLAWLDQVVTDHPALGYRPDCCKNML
jgi:hypothetical protein